MITMMCDMYVYVWCMNVNVWVYVPLAYLEAREHQMFSLLSALLPCFLETGFLTEPEAHHLDQAGLPGNSWNLLSLPRYWGFMDICSHVWLFMWVPGIQT